LQFKPTWPTSCRKRVQDLYLPEKTSSVAFSEFSEAAHPSCTCLATSVRAPLDTCTCPRTEAAAMAVQPPEYSWFTSKPSPARARRVFASRGHLPRPSQEHTCRSAGSMHGMRAMTSSSERQIDISKAPKRIPEVALQSRISVSRTSHQRAREKTAASIRTPARRARSESAGQRIDAHNERSFNQSKDFFCFRSTDL
jgi:hypothetical protein